MTEETDKPRVIIVRRGCVLAGQWHRCYVGRPSPLGNPFSHAYAAPRMGLIAVETRDEAIVAFAVWLDARPEDSPQRQVIREFADRVRAGERVALECHCAPLPCHAAVIADRILALADRKDICAPASPSP